MHARARFLWTFHTSSVLTLAFPSGWLCACTLLLAATLGAAEGQSSWSEGKQVPSLLLADAWGNALPLPKETRLLVICHDKDSGEQMNAQLDALGKSNRFPSGLVPVSDVRKMPWFVKKLVYPKLRELSFKLLLLEDKANPAPPQQEGKVTVVQLSPEGTVTAIRFVAAGDLAKEYAP